MSRSLLRGLTPLAATLAVLTTGCVAFPVLLPPAEVESGVGAMNSPGYSGANLDLQLRASVRPLGLAPSLHERDLDAAAGYLLDLGAGHLVQGGYLEAGTWSSPFPTGPGMLRMGGRAQARLLYDSRWNQFGAGLGTQLVAESSQFADGQYELHDRLGNFLGYAFGEAGLGLYLEGGLGWMGAGPVWNAGGGLLLHLPAAAGFSWLR